MYVYIRVLAYDMPTVRYEVIRPRHIYKSIVHVPAVSKKEGVDWMVEGAVDGIESTMSSIAFNRAALSGLWEVLSSGKRIRLALSTRSLKASFSASDEKVIPSENLHPAGCRFSLGMTFSSFSCVYMVCVPCVCMVCVPCVCMV